MATSYSYRFDNLTRIGNDTCGINARDVQNNNYGSYITTNYFTGHGTMKRAIEFATQQPNMFYKSGTGSCSVGGCNIDSESDLKIGTIQTNPRCRISLQERPFRTVPYLGRGPPKPELESKILQGSSINELKSCKTITEESFDNYNLTPQIPEIKDTVQNPNNLIESSAAEGWIRGGLPSRELTRNNNYVKNN
tara:strand:- start:14355 stop:14933 length:579 start_codon:yes stop_codon:yes gene_type:complete